MKYQLVRKRGAIRFRENGALRFLYDEAAAGRKCDLNDIWIARHAGAFSLADLQEFYRLLGYSVSGYGDIFPNAKSTREADAQVAATKPQKKGRGR